MGIDAELLVRNKSPLSEREVRKVSFALVEAFGVSNFLVSGPGEYSPNDPGEHALRIVPVYKQDGPAIHPREGEQLIRVGLFHRYYGQGYERGNLPLIVAIADWLEKRFSNSEIWYGGDSSGVCAEPFPESARAALFDYFCRVGHQPYRTAGSGQTCAFCADAEMVACRFGGGTVGYACQGCHLRRLVSKSGLVRESWRKWPDEED